MEVTEKRKTMPMIINYCSEDEVDLDDEPVVQSNSMMNYSDWKKSQKAVTKKNGKRTPRVRSDGSLEPLGDVSSSDDEFNYINDDQSIADICIDLTINKGRVKSSRNGFKAKKNEKKVPPKYLLFCRMKHQTYQASDDSWSFSELCRICQVHWEKLSDEEMKEFNDQLEQKLNDYQEELKKINMVLFSDRSLPKVTKVELEEEKEQPKQPIVEKEIPKKNEIPIRLQILAGTASVYHKSTPANSSKSNANQSNSGHTYGTRYSNSARHSVFSYKKLTDSTSSMGLLDYVAMGDEACTAKLNSDDISDDEEIEDTKSNNKSKHLLRRMCQAKSCENEAIDDLRWDSQYCSAVCLKNHCEEAFTEWVAVKRRARTLAQQQEERCKKEEKQEPQIIDNGENVNGLQTDEIPKDNGMPYSNLDVNNASDSSGGGDEVSFFKTELCETSASSTDSAKVITSERKNGDELLAAGEDHMLQSSTKISSELNLFSKLENHFAELTDTLSGNNTSCSGNKPFSDLLLDISSNNSCQPQFDDELDESQLVSPPVIHSRIPTLNMPLVSEEHQNK